MSKAAVKATKKVNPAVSIEYRQSMIEALIYLSQFLIDQGITVGEMNEYTAEAFVKAALSRAKMKNGRANQSRVAIMTGLTRTEVRRILSREKKLHLKDNAYGARRVIEGWNRDSEFTTKGGIPKKLGLGVGYGSFGRLARRYSGDIPPKATLDELIRLKTVDICKGYVSQRHYTETEIRRRSRTLSLATSQLSSVFALMGYPESVEPSLSMLDSVRVELSDKAALRVAELRVEQNGKAFLNGIETAMKSLITHKPSRAKPTTKSILVTLSVSKFS